MARSLVFVLGLGLGLGGCQQPIGFDVGSSESAVKVCAAGETTRGIDVSHWNGTIDWTAVKGDNVAFAFMKATEGTDFVDPQFATYWKNAGDAGVIRGAYHFFRPASDPIAQAEFFVATAGVPELGDLPLTIDLEVTDDQSDAIVANGALTFLARVEALSGRTPIIYTSARVFDTVLGTPAGFSHYPLWDANYSVTCPNISQPTWATWTFWQNTDKATILGIAGGVDQNFYNGSLAQLVDWVTTPPANSDGGTATADLLAPPADLAPPTPDLASAPDLAPSHLGYPMIRGGCGVAESSAPATSVLLTVVVAFALVRPRRES